MDDIIKRLVRPEIASKKWFFPAEDLMLEVRELLEKVVENAKSLSDAGVLKGDKVGFVCANSADFVSMLFACWTINAVAVPLKTQAGKFQRLEDYIERCHETCNFKILVCDDDVACQNENFRKIKAPIPVFSLSSFKNSDAESIEQLPSISPDDIAIIQFSSGSTGHPKGVIVTHGMLMAQLNNLEQQAVRPLKGSQVECYACWAPLNHDMGLFMGVLSPIYHGANNILAPPSYYVRNPMRWFQLMQDYTVEVAMFTNSVLAKSLPVIERKSVDNPLDLSHCHLYLGAEKVSANVVKEAYRVLEPFFGNRDNLYVAYGMAENALGVTTTFPGELSILRVSIDENNRVSLIEGDNNHGNEFVSVGFPYSDNIVTIRNDQGEILPELTLGEINISSTSLTPGYINNPEQSDKVLVDGRFKSGDMAFFYEGQLYFHSRKDDLIIMGGQNIVPDDIEHTVEELDFVRASSTALFSTEDEGTGLQKIFLLAESNANITEEDVLRRKSIITKYAFTELGIILNGVFLCAKGSIEKTSSGKKRRKVIKQRFIDRQIQLISDIS